MKKTLILRYLTVYILVLIVVLSLIDKVKEEKIEHVLSKETREVNQEYNSTFQNAQNLTEMIFFNHIFNNEKIINIYESQLSFEEKRDALYGTIKDNFFYFKSYGVEEINFYLNDGEVLLRSNYPQVNTQKEFSKRKSIKESLYNMKNFEDMEISPSSASIKFIKPLFDKRFKQIGSAEIALNMGRFSHMMNKNIDYDVSFVYRKSLLASKLFEEAFSKYLDFSLNAQYMIENTIYESFEKSEHDYNRIFKEHTNTINTKMNQAKEFAVVFQSGKNFYPMVFIPIFNKLTATHNGYLVAISNKKNLSLNKEIKFFNQLSLVFSVGTFLIFLGLYIIHLLKNKNSNIKRLHDDLKESIDKYVIMTETDLAGHITYVTQAFCDASGYTKRDLIGRPQNIVRHPDMSKRIFEAMWAKIKKGESWEGEIKNLDKNGNSYWIKGNIMPMYDRKKRIIGYRSIRVNITDQKQLMKVNSLLKDDLAYKLSGTKHNESTYIDNSKAFLMGKVLDAFASEWKRPISNISLQLLDLQTRINSDLYDKDYLSALDENIASEVKAISNKLNEFKTLFNYSTEEHTYNVYKTIEQSVSIMNLETDVRIKLKGERNLHIYGLSNDLRQVLISILRNSVEQLELQQIEDGKIVITVFQEDHFAIIRVKDNAGGIPAEILDKVFEPEFTTKYNSTSRGLGLYLSKLLIQKCNGDIWVENKDKGTCFFIKLSTLDRRKRAR